MNPRKTKALRVGIVCSQFNEFVVRALLDGAQRALSKHGVPERTSRCSGCRAHTRFR